ncbi:MAG: CPBP family intramembrane metalloprotease [Bacteroidaceae bacterium]|nr:CPBP family intramembrane metalloprotease [Bacteroidaceae bacterium]
MKRVWFLILLAFLLWTLMFSPWTAPHVPFWWTMTFSACTLTVLSTVFSPSWWKHLRWSVSNILLGFAIAIALWCVFWVGDKASQWLFPFARPQVNLIYGMKAGESPWLISVLLLFLIGPAEEIFWRGYVQRRLSQHYSPNVGFLLATACYTLVHVASLNFMLVMASMVCGIAWGGLYRLFPQRFPAIVLSHALWDAAVFVWFPI